MNPLDHALKASYDATVAIRGKSAKYVVSDSVSYDCVKVVPAETLRDNIGDEGLVTSSRTQDWLIHKNQIPGVEPVRGHKIIVDGETFEPIQYESEKPFRYHDAPTNSVYRIHTVLTEGSGG